MILKIKILEATGKNLVLKHLNTYWKYVQANSYCPERIIKLTQYHNVSTTLQNIGYCSTIINSNRCPRIIEY